MLHHIGLLQIKHNWPTTIFLQQQETCIPTTVTLTYSFQGCHVDVHCPS